MNVHIEKGTEKDIKKVAKLYDDLIDYLTERTNYPGWKKGVYPTIDDEAKANNIKSIRLDVFRKNIPAIKLYEGFRYEYLDTIDEGYSMYGLDLFRIYEKIIK